MTQRFLKEVRYSPFHKTLPKSSLQIHWISITFYDMGDIWSLIGVLEFIQPCLGDRQCFSPKIFNNSSSVGQIIRLLYWYLVRNDYPSLYPATSDSQTHFTESISLFMSLYSGTVEYCRFTFLKVLRWKPWKLFSLFFSSSFYRLFYVTLILLNIREDKIEYGLVIWQKETWL